MDELKEIRALFEKHRNPVNAENMKKYMKDLFPFLGLKMPERKMLEREFYTKTGLLKRPFNRSFVEELWKLPEREYQYVALGYIEKFCKRLGTESLPLLTWMLTEKSWWDTVDALATKPVGMLAKQYPEIQSVMDDWAKSENMWLRRTAILHQLKYKNETDEQRLYTYISQNAYSKEFFIQKAIGWALREYSKSNPESVKKFILSTELASLSRREGSKYLG
ncbi:DNA alkylation repair protein [Bacillus sp. FJAT-27225]|uniref:DNA alkylation repair protein n=1 Tax=Bacillus sp. FJAT-27225 TaxID=1743144 RepID=UPI00080C23D4|nr:DNA alkylation repair protein [Bacillus sp. FJAT-27225]OCA82319.1 DNA alkylation repair protein [Bacillus sp. FJAT-27225]